MLARHRGKVLVAFATAAIVAGAFVAVSANSETAQSPMQVQSAVLPESTTATTTTATQASMVPTASVAEPRVSSRRADSQRRVVQNLPPVASAPRAPLILGIHH
jgi:hypothetical protein